MPVSFCKCRTVRPRGAGRGAQVLGETGGPCLGAKAIGGGCRSHDLGVMPQHPHRLHGALERRRVPGG